MNLIVNDKVYNIEVSGDQTLLGALRDGLRLTGTKCGCGIGVCGTCTVLINGEPKRTCVVKLSQIREGDKIVTIEGLEKDGRLHPVQEAFIEAGAIQCGFCTPGMVLTAVSFLNKNLKPTKPEIKKAFALNLCRCTGYQQIFDAVLLAAKKMQTIKIS